MLAGRASGTMPAGSREGVTMQFKAALGTKTATDRRGPRSSRALVVACAGILFFFGLRLHHIKALPLFIDEAIAIQWSADIIDGAMLASRPRRSRAASLLSAALSRAVAGGGGGVILRLRLARAWSFWPV